MRVSEKLLELVSLTADEVNGLTAEQAAALKAQKQEAVRANIDAEKKGTGDLKLNKASNLNDLADKVVARKNISVYSTTEIDKLLEKKLNADAAYNGVSFTEEMRQKLENIKGGNFAYIDTEGVSHAQVEGFVTSSQVVKELNKKANLLLDGYNESQKTRLPPISMYIAKRQQMGSSPPWRVCSRIISHTWSSRGKIRLRHKECSGINWMSYQKAM